MGRANIYAHLDIGIMNFLGYWLIFHIFMMHLLIWSDNLDGKRFSAAMGDIIYFIFHGHKGVEFDLTFWNKHNGVGILFDT